MLAAKITNAVASTYLRMEQGLRLDQARGANAWLAGEIDQLRLRVADAEAKAEAFRSRTNLLVGTNNTTLNNQQLGEINSQVAAARGQKADSETRAKIIREMLRRGETIELSDVVNSELIRRLSEQRGALRAQLAEQSTQLLDRHPRIMELKAQVGDLDKQIRAEADKIARSLENDARVASAKVDASSANLDMVKKQAATTGEQDVQLRALDREAKAQRDLLESYLARYRETTARETIGTAPADAKIISSAIASNTPYFPKKLPIVSVATLITFILFSGLVATGELLRQSSGAGVIPVAARPETRVDLASRAKAAMSASRRRRACHPGDGGAATGAPAIRYRACRHRRRRATAARQCLARPRRRGNRRDPEHRYDAGLARARSGARGRRQGRAGEPCFRRCRCRRRLGFPATPRASSRWSAVPLRSGR